MSFDPESVERTHRRLVQDLLAAFAQGNRDLRTEEDFVRYYPSIRDAVRQIQDSLAGFEQALRGPEELERTPEGKLTRTGIMHFAAGVQGKSESKDVPESEKTEDLTFSTFLSNVGGAVVAAQRDLDKQSVAYVADVLQHEQIPPSIFRIPKLSAQMRVSMVKSSARGFNVILASRKDEAQELNEQSIELEIVAVPPPVEAVRAIQAGAPGVEFLLEPLRRAELVTLIQENFSTHPGHRILTEEGNRDRVLFWLVGEMPERYLLLLANPAADKLVGIWHLTLDPPRLDFVLSYNRGPAAGETFRPLRDFVHELGEEQARLLRELSRPGAP